MTVAARSFLPSPPRTTASVAPASCFSSSVTSSEAVFFSRSEVYFCSWSLCAAFSASSSE
eukprot:CAMPEP_0117530678 /NCGR_PEP_ID=MMETSP0784-20121206/38468_1 /TAXON_ID=39447 /ORGANISM="" /LENGTH=59 /DNA_ID=CAMNT_0005327031 /DNA_START=48 /DNA_END=224 /DNA_ORIENTATION=+